MSWVGAVGLAAAGAVGWSVYFRYKDRFRPEPLKLLGGSLLLGALAAVLALGAYKLLDRAGVPDATALNGWSLFLFCVAAIGLIEEGVKFAAFRAVAARWPEFDERIDGLVYASMVAVGFASVENLIYARFAGWPEQFGRAAASPLTHALFSAIWGLSTARALLVRTSRLRRFLWQAVPLLTSMVLHGVYDYLLLAHHATLSAAAVVLVLWIGLLALLKR